MKEYVLPDKFMGEDPLRYGETYCFFSQTRNNSNTALLIIVHDLLLAGKKVLFISDDLEEQAVLDVLRFSHFELYGGVDENAYDTMTKHFPQLDFGSDLSSFHRRLNQQDGLKEYDVVILDVILQPQYVGAEHRSSYMSQLGVKLHYNTNALFLFTDKITEFSEDAFTYEQAVAFYENEKSLDRAYFHYKGKIESKIKQQRGNLMSTVVLNAGTLGSFPLMTGETYGVLLEAGMGRSQTMLSLVFDLLTVGKKVLYVADEVDVDKSFGFLRSKAQTQLQTTSLDDFLSKAIICKMATNVSDVLYRKYNPVTPFSEFDAVVINASCLSGKTMFNRLDALLTLSKAIHKEGDLTVVFATQLISPSSLDVPVSDYLRDYLDTRSALSRIVLIQRGEELQYLEAPNGVS